MANGILGRMDWGDWVRGIFAGFIGGGAGAFTGGLSTVIVDPDHYNFLHPQKVLTVMGAMFLINGLISMAAYLHQHPLPDVVTVTTIQTSEVTQNPPTLKVTKVEETKTEAPKPGG